MLKTRIHDLVMGKRPNNSVFSYNFHNISHIVRFMKNVCATLPTSKLRFLDVGGGACPYYGIFEARAHEYVVSDVEVYLTQEDARPIRAIRSAAELLPFATNTFDVVLSNQVLEHVQDERLTVTESFRVLKPGGLFIGSVPHISPIHLEPHDYRRFTMLGLENLLTQNGFANVVIEGNGGVHRAAALLILMDWYLSQCESGKPQQFKTKKHLLLFPLNGVINLGALLADRLLGDKNRSPSNYCWRAEKPS
jgi:SAM-dependent methyltransferase